MDEACVFCRVIKGELPCEKVYENEEILAFLDIHPSAPVHVVVVPKKHIISFMDTQSMESIFAAAKKIVELKGIEKSYKIEINGGDLQEVKHLHVHVKGGVK